jgi:hypothetical protein
MKTDEQILSELKEASAGLLFMSESEYPFEVVRVDGVEELTDALTESVEDFFRVAASEAEWRSPAERAEAKRYQALIALLEENLEQVMAYRVGSIKIQVFLIGRSASGSWLGLSTRVVET